ncbi:MAG: diguanylate cyclase/phosphodiesterase (GGDEF & EAL domains) with PAS/PAC sensor(s) [Rhodanobacteraceae bacterium]|jgi:diguanylate cyclase (GGDEF)-like protein|nr:MAG: diguanylate cyclase/phosphodiesterase (GGDEF & EAL domains) with PAS/PAC sensor(s) [Rhodanobacteraceae bacterium]
MGSRSVRWGWLLLVWPLAAWAGDADVRVTALSSPPASMTAPAVASLDGQGVVVSRVWLRAPRAQTAWYALRLARNWHQAERPVLAIQGNVRARLTAYLPPDYRPRTATVFDATLDPTYSHHALVYPLPPDLRADQPIYVALGDPGQTQPIQLGIADEASYRASDLRHVRASTFFASVEASMVLVILCFWIVLRDRMFLYFIVYVGAQVVYGMSASGELFALPGATLLAPLGYHTGQSAAALAAAFSIWFILDFADLHRFTPRLAAAFGVLRWPLLALAAIVWLPWLRPDAWLPNTVNFLLVVSTALVLASSWLAWRRGNRQAGFFLLSWVPLLALTMARVVQLIAGFRLSGWLEYGFPASMAWSAVIITVGLADRTLQVRHERDQASDMAQRDPLTGVFNRRAIMERLRQAWRSSTVSEPLATLFLDIDHFKQINDSHGHAAGDACLNAITDAIREELAERDHVGRYGGEEFLIVLHGDSARVAQRVAERMVARAEALRIPAKDGPITFTVSVGVALREASVANVDALVQRADAAQYRAKAEGRNRVVVWRSGLADAPLARTR